MGRCVSKVGEGSKCDGEEKEKAEEAIVMVELKGEEGKEESVEMRMKSGALWWWFKSM